MKTLQEWIDAPAEDFKVYGPYPPPTLHLAVPADIEKEFDESKHPRDQKGQFTSSDGGEVFAEQAGQVARMKDRAARLLPFSNTRDMDTPEAQKQLALRDAQTNPLAHPFTVLGMDNATDMSGQRYVAAYGQEFTAAPLPADIERGPYKECFKNASLLVMQRNDLTYVEGYGTPDNLHDLTFLHAWAVDAQGVVYDNTWDNPEKSTYFGVKYDRTKYIAYLYKARIYGVLGSTNKNYENAIATGGSKLR